jgi:hypothetical protein
MPTFGVPQAIEKYVEILYETKIDAISSIGRSEAGRPTKLYNN